MNKIKINYKFILFLLINLIYIINIYLDIKEANFVLPVSVEINSDYSDKSKIIAYRISVSNYEQELFRDEKFNVFYSFKGEYLTNIKIKYPSEASIKFIKVIIGDKEFYCNDNNINDYFVSSNIDDNVILLSKASLSASRSVFPKLNKIINWTGDFNFFVIRYMMYLFTFCLLIAFNCFIKNKIKFNCESNYLLQLNDYFFCNENNKYLYKTIYRSLLLFIIIFAIFQRFTINVVPYDGYDTGSYIVFLKHFNGEKITDSATRGYPYLLFVLSILKIFNDFSYISIVQHILGIISGLIMLYIWNDIFNKKFLFDNRYKILFDFIGLVLIALYLFNQSVIVYEHSIRPEGVYQFFLILYVLAFYKIITNLGSNKNVFLYMNIFFFLNYFIFVMQPRWGIALIFNIIVFFIILIVLKINIIKKIIFLIATPVIFALVLIYIPNNIFSKKDIKGTFLSGKLFFTHVKIIDKILIEDINNPYFNKYDKNILQQLVDYHKIEYNKKQYKHKYLGFSHNNLFYGDANKLLFDNFSRDQYNEFCRYYFFRAIKKYPFLYIKKVFLELSQFYNFSGGMYPSRKFKVDHIAFDHDDDNEPEIRYLPLRKYSNILSYLKRSYYDFNEIRFPGIEAFYFILSRLYICTFVVFFIIFIKKIFEKNFDINNNNIIFGLLIVNLFISNFCITLTNASIYCLDVDRYIDDQYIFVLFSQVLAVVYIFCNLLNKRKVDDKK
jgi:hypothetical protein